MPGTAPAPDYSRQIALRDVGPAGQEKLRAASVLVIGAGGLGVPVLQYLAGAGVGRLGIVDGDVLEPSNLHRQTWYSLAECGREKATLAAGRVRALNPDVRTEAHVERLAADNSARLCEGYDLIVDCSDNFSTKFLLNDFSLRSGKPVLFASVYQYEGQLQFVRGGAGSPCLRCVWPEARDGLVGNCAEAGVLGPVPGVFGSLQALEALKYLLGLPGLGDDVLIFDLVTLSSQRLRARRESSCAAHAGGAEAPAASLEVAFDSLAEAQLAGFVIVDVRDARERDMEPLVVPSVAPAHDAAAHRRLEPRSRGAVSARLRDRYAQHGRGGPAAFARGSRVPVAARRPWAPQDLGVKSRVSRFGAAGTVADGGPSPTKSSMRDTRFSISRASARRCSTKAHIRRHWAPARIRCGTCSSRRACPPMRIVPAASERRDSRSFTSASPRACTPTAIWRARRRRIDGRSPAVLAPAILHAALGGVLFDARDYAGARAATEAALALDARSISTIRIAANLDFIDERWADAISRFRYVAASDPDRVRAGYGQLMYWLAQSRAGIAHPLWVTRTPGEGWPQPLLLYLRGQYTEEELVVPINEGDDDDNNQPNTSTDERLAEALYYLGQAHWARGDSKTALDYFTALVNLRVTYFLEHGLAIAEVAKLRK